MPPALDRAPRRPRRRSRPNPQALRDVALSAPARPLSTAARAPKPTRVRRARKPTPNPLKGVAQRTPAMPLSRAPKPPDLSAPRRGMDARAHSQQNQYVSEGRSVEKAAHGQQRQAYADLPLHERRAVLRQALRAENPTKQQRAALEVHHERHAGDVQAERATGGLLPRELLKIPKDLDLRLSWIPKPSGVPLRTVAVNQRQQRQVSLNDATGAALSKLDELARPDNGGDFAARPGEPDWQPDPSIAHVPGANLNPQAKGLGPEKKTKFSGSTQALGLTLPGLHQGAWTAGRVLEQVSRPLHAVAGGLKAAQENKNVGTAIVRGLENKDKYTISDLPSVKSIQNPVARFAAGVGGDVLFDPLTAVTLGADAPADALLSASRQAQRLSEAADAAGNTAKAAKLASRSRELAIRASEAPTNRGIQLGLRSPVGARGRALKTSGTATAQASKLLGIPHLATTVRESAPAQAFGKALVPGFRPAGVSAHEWEKTIAAETSARAQTRTGLRAAEDLGKGFDTAIKNAARGLGRKPEDVGREIVWAIEGNAVDHLPASMRPIAEEFQRRMAGIAGEERKAGVLTALRSNYVPHQWDQTITGRSTADRVAGGQRNVFADKRSIEGTVAQINAKADADGIGPIFSENVPGLAALRAGKSAKVLGKAAFHARIVNDGIARAVTDARKYSVAHPGDFLYELKPGGMTAIEDSRGGIDWSEAEKKIREGKQVVGMNKIIGDRYTKGYGKIVTTEGPTIGRGFDRFMSGLKTALTVLNVPAYDLRNLTGDSFNAYLADTSLSDIRDAARAMGVQHARQKASRELAYIPGRVEERVRHVPGVQVSTRLKPLGEVTIEKGAPALHAHDYRPSAQKINERTWYHGTNVEGLTAEQLQGGGTDIANLFGQGIYLTDDPKIAGEYAAARTRRGGSAHVYAAKVTVRKALDLEARAHPDFASALADRLRHLPGGGDPEAADAILRRAKRGDTNDQIYKAFKEDVSIYSHHEQIPRSELVEDFQILASDLRERGFDALTHVGGNRVGKSNHQVVILLDPENAGASLTAGRQAQSFTRAAQPVRLRVTKHGVERVETPVTRAVRERVQVTPDKSFETGATIKIGGERANVADLLARAEKSGAIQTGFVGGEKFETVRGTQAAGIKTKFGGVHPVEKLRAVGQVREDWIRFATWLGAKRRGMSDEEAAKWANMHHFDYADLTDTERGLLRRVFPFWTFTSRNTRLQVTKLLTNPGKYANYQAVREEMAKQAGLGPDWEHHLEPYQQRGAGIPFRAPGHKGASMAYPGLPLMDLSRFGALLSPKDEGDLVLQNLNPLIKTPVEALQNYSFFFKGPIWRDAKNPDARHWVPAPPQFAGVPGVRGLLGMKKIPDSHNRNKPTWMMTAKADYLLRQLPQSNFAIQALTPATGSHGQGSKQSIVSQLTGVKLGDYDRNTVELRNAQRHMQDLRLKQNDLKDQGQDRSPGGGHYSKAYRKTLDDINSTQKRIDKLKKRKGYAPPRKPVRGPRKQRGSGIYGAGGGGSVYGAPASGSLYGAP